MDRQDFAPGFVESRVAQFEGRAEYRVVDFDSSRWPFMVNGFGLKRAQSETGRDIQALLFGVVLAQARGALFLSNLEESKKKALKKAAEALGEEDPGVQTVAASFEDIAFGAQAQGFTSNMEAYFAYFFAGVVTFYPELTFDELLMRATEKTMAEIEPLVGEEIARLQALWKESRNGQAEPEETESAGS